MAILAKATDGAVTIDSVQVRTLLAIAFFFPVLLCAILLPSPASDLREHINFGLTYRLDGFAAPPLQTWLAGAVALTGARDAWLYIAVAQALNFVGLVYLVLIAKRFIGETAVVPLALMFCGTIYYSLATPTMALNADQIQVPLWAGITFHGLMALRDDRWRDWILCGVLIGVGVLAKYTVFVWLAVLFVAVLLIPDYRKVFLNPKLYVAAALRAADHRRARGAGMVRRSFAGICRRPVQDDVAGLVPARLPLESRALIRAVRRAVPDRARRSRVARTHHVCAEFPTRPRNVSFCWRSFCISP